jgi:magnesium and cobalt transporter
MSDPQPAPAIDDRGEAPHRTLLGTVRGWLRALRQSREDMTPRQALAELIAEEGDAVRIDPRERDLLLNILQFGGLRADDVMVPRADIDAVPADISLAELVRVFNDRQHTRLPVYRETLDDVIGFVHLKDLMARWGETGPFALKDVVRNVLFAPPSMPVPDLLIRMRTTRIHMALVIDEYGGVDGLITIEDLVEQIVGDIEDEHDEREGPLLLAKDDGSWEADARAPIDQFEAEIGRDLLPDDEDEYIDTLGGLVVSLIGRVPQRGELVSHPAGLEFEVVDADPRRVKRLKVRVKPLAASAEQ